ncbi:RDD family protein [Chitinophaga lutea]
MPVIKIPTAFNIDLEFEGADLGRRLVAYIIDLMIRLAYIMIASWMLNKVSSSWDHETEDAIELLVIGLPITFYYLVSEMLMKGQSVGKKVMGLKVVSLIGNIPSLSQVLLRWMFRLIESPLLTMVFIANALANQSFLSALVWLAVGAIPVIVVLRSDFHQRLGDIAAGTIVVRSRQQHSIHDTIFRQIDTADYVVSFPQALRLSDRDLGKVKSVLDNAYRSGDISTAARIAGRIQEVLRIQTHMDAMNFLETLLNDYNYLVTRG